MYYHNVESHVIIIRICPFASGKLDKRVLLSQILQETTFFKFFAALDQTRLDISCNLSAYIFVEYKDLQLRVKN